MSKKIKNGKNTNSPNKQYIQYNLNKTSKNILCEI